MQSGRDRYGEIQLYNMRVGYLGADDRVVVICAHCRRVTRLTAAELIRIVASPGGTTEAALRKFEDLRFSDIVAGAVHAAADRSRVLGRS